MKVLHCLAVLALVGCGATREQFIGTRIAEACDGEWNVCATTVGCFVGDQSYVEGRFPGKNSVGLRIFEPSEVTVTVHLFELAGAGERTVITLNEGGCTARQRVEITGKALTSENERIGWVTRAENLTSTGDHLIEIESDARAQYLLKLDVLPLRLKDAE